MLHRNETVVGKLGCHVRVVFLRGICVAGLLALFVQVGLTAEPLATAQPADVEMSAEKLQQGVQLFEDAIAKDTLRGAVLLVTRRGKIVLHTALGWRNKQEQQPMERDTIFRMASNTKPLVATAILMLAEEGRLSLDDEISQHLPAFKNDKCQGMRIKHLLSHTSGFRIKTLFLNPLRQKSLHYPTAPNLQIEVDRFADVGPAEKTGTSFSYSNAGFNTLGAIVEVCSGQPLEEFLTARIYQPLGMPDTSNHPPRDELERMAVVYEFKKPTGDDAAAGEWKIRFHQSTAMRVPFVRASGGGISTAGDYARFCQMWLNGGTFAGRRYLSNESVEAASAPQTRSLYTEDELKTRTTFYGYGWGVAANGIYSHSGSEGTYAWIDPRRELIGLVLTQSVKGVNPRKEFAELVGSACEE